LAFDKEVAITKTSCSSKKSSCVLQQQLPYKRAPIGAKAAKYRGRAGWGGEPR
jgi:hypothetical protein